MSMSEMQEQRMRLRETFSREKDELFSDNIPAYADWLERKLAKMILDQEQREERTESMKAAWRSPDKD